MTVTGIIETVHGSTGHRQAQVNCRAYVVFVDSSNKALAEPLYDTAKTLIYRIVIDLPAQPASHTCLALWH